MVTEVVTRKFNTYGTVTELISKSRSFYNSHTGILFLDDLPLEFVVLYRILLAHFPRYKHEAHSGRKRTGSYYKTSEELVSDGGNRDAVECT